MKLPSFSVGLQAGLLAAWMVHAVSAQAAEVWRSSLYPSDWKPGLADETGRFLHDFSYAGYHRGERPVPTVAGPVIDATVAPYLADPGGERDATAAIQAALDAAGAAGGGVVYLPAGTYRVAPPEGKTAALRIEYDNTVLRGAGMGKTRLFNDSVAMREKRVISVRPGDAAWWFFADRPETTRLLTTDLTGPASRLPVADAEPFAPGDLVVVRIDPTERFIAELGMTEKWALAADASKQRRNQLTLFYLRRVVSTQGGEVVIDTPTRLPLRVADRARVQKLSGRLIREAGVEDLSIGMRQHRGEGWGEEDYTRAGTGAFDAHQSYAVAFDAAENCWLRRVGTWAPPGNDPAVHLLSNGVLLGRGRQLTVQGCDFRNAQYQGGGGNGYLYVLHGNEGLIRECFAENGRHNYDFGLMSSSGNVILDCVSKDGRLFSDFHMYLSAANLIDNMTCDGDSLEAVYRPWGGSLPHGVTTTESVFWNTRGLRYSKGKKEALVVSKQWGHGYVIGTSGPASRVDSDDFVEGVGRGESLEPRSLYLDQLERRLGRAER